MKRLSLAFFLSFFALTAWAQSCPIDGTPCVRFETARIQLYKAETLMRGLNVDFSTAVPVTLQTAGVIEFEHRNIYSGPVGIHTKIGVRCVPLGYPLPELTGTYAPTPAYPVPSVWVKGGKSGGNISSIQDHYGRTLLTSPPTMVGPGNCRVEVWGASYTSANTADGNAQVNIPYGDPVAAAADPYNHFIVRLTP